MSVDSSDDDSLPCEHLPLSCYTFSVSDVDLAEVSKDVVRTALLPWCNFVIVAESPATLGSTHHPSKGSLLGYFELRAPAWFATVQSLFDPIGSSHPFVLVHAQRTRALHAASVRAFGPYVEESRSR